MTTTYSVRCDGPDCRRERFPNIHANTWFKLSYERVGTGKESDNFSYWAGRNTHMHPMQTTGLDLCSLYCLEKWIKQELEIIGIDAAIRNAPHVPLEEAPDDDEPITDEDAQALRDRS